MPPRPPAAADSGSGVTPGGPAHARPGPQHSRGQLRGAPAERVGSGVRGQHAAWGQPGRPSTCPQGRRNPQRRAWQGQDGGQSESPGEQADPWTSQIQVLCPATPAVRSPRGPLRRGDLDDHWSVGRPRDTGESRVLCERSLGPQPRDAAGGPGSQTRRGPHRRRPCVSPARGPGGWLCALPCDVTREVHTPCIDRGRVCAVCGTGSLGRAS